MMIGNAEYQCSCVRYVTRDSSLPLIVGLSVALTLLLVVVIIVVGIVLYRRRQSKLTKDEQVPEDGSDTYTSQDNEERQYSRQLPGDYFKDATSMELEEQRTRQLFNNCLVLSSTIFVSTKVGRIMSR